MEDEKNPTLAQVDEKLTDAVRRNDARDWLLWHRAYSVLKRIEASSF